MLIGVFLTAVAVNIFKNLKANLPVKSSALINNALKNYFSLVIFGIVMILMIALIKKTDMFLINKIMHFAARHMHQGLFAKLYFIGMALTLFFSNLILQIFLILTIPVMVIEKKALVKALGRSISFGFRRFFTIFGLIFLPFLVYLPFSLLRSLAPQLVDRTFPEITVFIIVAGIVAAIFIDCFTILCVSQLLLDTPGKETKKT